MTPTPSSAVPGRRSPNRTAALLLAFVAVLAVSLATRPRTARAAEAESTNAPATPAPAAPATTNAAVSAETRATEKNEADDAADPKPSASATVRSDRPASGERDPRRSSRRGSDRSSRRSDRGGDSGGSTNQLVGATGTDFASFKIITERNIFNPNRGRGGGRGDREPARKPVQIDLITLVGALSYAKGDFAFFDGSASQFRKTLKCGDSIAGYAVKTITPGLVRLEAGEKTVEMSVGSQLRREDEGEWRFIPRADATAASSGSGSGSSSASGSSGGGERSAASADAGGAANDILERLRKKREQEK